MLLFTAELGYNFFKFWGEEGKGFSLFFRTNVGYVPQEKFDKYISCCTSLPMFFSLL